MTNPFKGPFPLETGDPIFGRDREIEDLLSLLVANRLVLLHSVSGCGKSSLIEAGLRPRLKGARLRGLPTIRMPRRSTRDSSEHNGLLATVIATLRTAGRGAAEDGAGGQESAKFAGATSTLEAYLRRGTTEPTSEDAQCFDLLIFDQFEEVLDASHASEQDRIEFFRQVGIALKDRTRWALFAMREDYLGALEPYLRYLPTYLAARFRLAQLTVKDAEHAILGISGGSAVPFEPQAAERLARELSAGGDTPRPANAGRFVEPVYLQVVSRYIWDGCHQQEKAKVTAADIVLPGSDGAATTGTDPSLAPVEIALQQYYDAAVTAAAGDSPQALARVRRWFTEELISFTPHGEQRRQTLWTPLSVVHAETVKVLENRYVIRKDERNGTWYELAHDRLVQPVLRSNLAFRRQLRQPWQEAAETWGQENEDRAFLVLRGQTLQEAFAWADANRDRIEPREWKFLAQCRQEARVRRKLKIYRRVSIAVVALLAVIVTGLLAWAGRLADVGARAVASAAEADQSRVGSERLTAAARSAETQARRAEKESYTARLAANKERDASLAALARSKAEATKLVRAADDASRRAQAYASATRQAADTASAEAARQISQARLDRQEALKRTDEAAVEVENLNAVTRAYDQVSQAQRESVLEDALAAAETLSSYFGSRPWTDRGRQALNQSLSTMGHLFSRNLLVQSHQTATPVLGLALDATTNCIHYMSDAGASPIRSAVDQKACDPIGKNPNRDVAGAASVSGDERDRTSDVLRFVTSSAVSEDASVVAIGSALGDMQVARKQEPLPRVPFRAHRHEVMTTYVSPNGRYLASAGALWTFDVRDLQQWPPTDKKPKVLFHHPRRGPLGWYRWLRTFRGETTHTVNAFAVDERGDSLGRSGPVLATARRDGAIEFFDVVKRKQLLKVPGPTQRDATLLGHDKPPTALAFDSTGLLLASGGQDGRVFVWRLPRSATEWHELDRRGRLPPAVPLKGCADETIGAARGGSITTVAFSPDDRILAIGCQTGIVLMYYLPRDLATGPPPRPVEPLLTLVGQPNAMVFNRQNRRLLVGGSAARVEEWYIPTEAVMRRRQDVLRQIDAARESRIDLEKLSAMLTEVKNSAPRTVERWEPRQGPEGAGQVRW